MPQTHRNPTVLQTADDLLSLADSRHVLHARVYQHKTVKLIEAMSVIVIVCSL